MNFNSNLDMAEANLGMLPFLTSPDQMPNNMPHVDQQSKDTLESVQLVLKWIVEYQIKLTQQLGKIEEKLDKVSEKTQNLEKKINEQSEKMDNLEMYLHERSQAIIERQNDCIGLLECPGLRANYALSNYSQESDSLSNYSESSSQESESISNVFGQYH